MLPVAYSSVNSLQLELTTCKEISFYITKMQCKKSPGYDLISAQLLKELPSCGIKFIRNIFNAMFRLLYFPKVWKIAQMTAIY